VIQDNIAVTSIVSGIGTGTANTTTLNFSRIGTKVYINGYLSITAPGTGSSEMLLTLSGLTCTSVEGTVVLSKGDGTFTTAIALVSGSSIRFKQTDNTMLIGSEVGTASSVVAYINFENVVCNIAEWAGSGTVNLASNDVEYAYNTSTSTTSDSTSFGYGPSGAQFQSFAPAGTASVLKRVRFQTPIQDGDDLTIQVYVVSRWINMSDWLGSFSTNDAGNAYYGCTLDRVSGSNTDVEVSFFSKITAAEAWSSYGGSSSFKWRVRKVSASSVAGFQMANATSAGLVSTQAQTFSGEKTIQDATATQLIVKGIGTDPRMRFYSDSTSRGVIAYDSTNSFYVMSEGALNLFANGGSGGIQPVRISTSGFMDVGRATASGCAFSANSASNVTIGGFYSTLASGYNSEVTFIYSAMSSGTGYKFIRCDNATQAAIFYVDGRGYIYAGSTTVSSSSDARLKDNITSLPDGSLSKIMQLKPSTWTWKQEDRAGETKGFIAQDVEVVYPEFVEEDSDGFKTLGINGAPMIAELVKAIQEQQKQIEELKAEVAFLKNK
jgi:hypothetical protein